MSQGFDLGLVSVSMLSLGNDTNAYMVVANNTHLGNTGFLFWVLGLHLYGSYLNFALCGCL